MLAGVPYLQPISDVLSGVGVLQFRVATLDPSPAKGVPGPSQIPTDLSNFNAVPPSNGHAIRYRLRRKSRQCSDGRRGGKAYQRCGNEFLEGRGGGGTVRKYPGTRFSAYVAMFCLP